MTSGSHSYCRDFGKSLLKTISAPNPPRFSIDENYPREIHNLKLRTINHNLPKYGLA